MKVRVSDVLGMRKMRAQGHPYKSVGEKFGVSITHARRVCIGEWYKGIGGEIEPRDSIRHKISDDVVRLIKKMKTGGASYEEIGNATGVSHSHIYKIVSGKLRKNARRSLSELTRGDIVNLLKVSGLAITRVDKFTPLHADDGGMLIFNMTVALEDDSPYEMTSGLIVFVDLDTGGIQFSLSNVSSNNPHRDTSKQSPHPLSVGIGAYSFLQDEGFYLPSLHS